MPLTKYALEQIGFTEIPVGTVIEATFFSAILYSIDGIDIKNNNSESSSTLCYSGNDFSFAFGNSINEISKKLLNDNFVEDELSWEKEKKIRPPYFLVHFGIKHPFTCTSGYWKEDKDKLITYDCFSDAKHALKEIEDKIIPSLISSLTVQLSQINNTIRFKLVNRTVFANTNLNKELHDILMTSNAQLTISRAISLEDIKLRIDESMMRYSKFELRVASLFHSGLKEENRFKKFLTLFQALEIYTHKSFDQLNFEKHIDTILLPPERLKKTSRQFFVERKGETKNLTQRFIWCAILLWKNLEDIDLESFKAIKRNRDELSHGAEIQELKLPVESLENLLLKIL